MRTFRQKCVALILILFCGLLAGCFESKQDYTLNPDGSGKVVLEVLFDPSTASLSQSSSDPEKQAQSAVKKILQSAKGVDAWKDVTYKRMPDGRVSFKGTAYFPDLNKLDIENYGTDFSLTRKDNFLVLLMKEEDKDKKAEKATAPQKQLTDQEIEAQIKKAKTEWERSRPMMTAMLSGLKKEATIHLPGKIVELNNFTRVSDTVVQTTLDGAKMLEALDAAMVDEAWMRERAKTGGFTDDGPPIDENLNEKYFGKPGPLMAKAEAGSKPQFNYKQEAAAAQKSYPQLLESLGVVAKLPTGSELKEGVNFSAGEIKDSRTTGEFFGGLSVELIMAGDVLQNARSIRALNVTKAIDDQGTDLLKQDEENSFSGSFGFSGSNEGQLRQELKLKNPPRAATAIKELSGEVHLYMPDKDPAAKIVIKNFLKQTGKPIASKTLKAAKIEVAVLTREQFDAMKAAKEEQDQNGTEPSAATPAGILLKAFSDTFNSYMSVADTDLVFMTKDPGGRLVDMEVTDANGTPLNRTSSSGGLETQVISYEEFPPEDSQLVLYTETTKSLVTTRFSLKDLTLP